MSEAMRLKLLIDTKGKKVLFAEAGKDFVDFLFQLLALPLGTAVSLLKEQTTGGSLANLYESLHELSYSYIESTKNKDMFLKPVQAPLPLPPTTGLTGITLTFPYAAKKAAGVEGGVVKGLVTYMVMDDLVISPSSTISSITLLNKLNVKDVGALEEKVVDFGVNEAVKLLNATLQSKQVLTDVFFKSIQIKTEPK